MHPTALPSDLDRPLDSGAMAAVRAADCQLDAVEATGP